jgi:hypothetical protein
MRIAAEADLPRSGEATAPIPSTAEDLLTSLGQPDRPGSSWICDLPARREPSPTIRESQHAGPTQPASTEKTPTAGRRVPQHAAIPTVPVAEPADVSPSASLSPPPAVPIVDKGREQMFQASQIQHPPPPKLDQTGMATDSTVQPKSVQSGRSGGYPPGSKTTFRYRVRKECGPIHDPALRRQCTQSFHYW